jgi:glycosyltransferase involved in cell wall biosynthesis
MRIAFYAPMKSPRNPVPSGDRELARLIMHALRHAGHEVAIASQFRSYEGRGDPLRQQAVMSRIARAQTHCVERLCFEHGGTTPDLWFTYHLYHKAPDFLGPALAERFGIPYVVADASHAGKQAAGPWAAWHRSARAAILAADRLVAFDPVDTEALRDDLGCGHKLLQLPPFTRRRAIGRAAKRQARIRLARTLKLDPLLPWIVTVAMMRDDVKSESYRLLANALKRLDGRRFVHLIVGDGDNRAGIEAAFAPFRGVRFLGQCHGKALTEAYAAADFLAWPALNEGCSMALLEAQATGLPVLAGARSGVEQFIRDGETGLLCPEGDEAGFAAGLRRMLEDVIFRRHAGKAAADHIAARHSLPAAAEALDAMLQDLRRERAA